MQNKLFAHDSVNVVIVDMLPMFRLGMKSTLKSLHYIGKIFEAQNGIDAKLILLNEKVDVVYLISRKAGFDCLEITRELLYCYPESRFIYLSMEDEEDEIIKMIKLGVHGFISKYVDQIELDQSMKTVLANSKYFTPEISNILAKKLCNGKSKSDCPVELSKERIRDVLFLLCYELSNYEIADLLFLSHRTIEYYRKKINRLTGAKNQLGVLKFALKDGILEDEKLLLKWNYAIDAKLNKVSLAI